MLLLSGTASLAAYQTVLASVQYNNTIGGPGVASETINVVANDGISNSNTAVSTITISAAGRRAQRAQLRTTRPVGRIPARWPITGVNALPLVSGLSNPLGIAVSGANLWVANTGGGTIGEYNATTGAVVNAALVSGLNSPTGIAVSGGNLWVANHGNGTIGEYNATTGAVVNAALVSGLNAPTGIAVSGGNLWVTNV